MAERSSQRTKKEANRGAWTAEEDQKLAQVIELHGPRRWKSLATKAGLERCGKSCRLRWMNYLRPNIKRGNISDQEEDLILRLHKLLGNRWSLIAGRLPGRTDNEIKNYWNSHLRKKIRQMNHDVNNEQHRPSFVSTNSTKITMEAGDIEILKKNDEGSSYSKRDKLVELSTKVIGFNEGNDMDQLFDCSSDDHQEGLLNLDWMTNFLDMDDTWFDFLS